MMTSFKYNRLMILGWQAVFAYSNDFLDINECSCNPCGENTVCQDTFGSYVCVAEEKLFFGT